MKNKKLSPAMRSSYKKNSSVPEVVSRLYAETSECVNCDVLNSFSCQRIDAVNIFNITCLATDVC